MSLLVRLLGNAKAWQAVASEEELSAVIQDLPPWVIREFTPSQRDQVSLSVFEIASADELEDKAELIAGAFAFWNHPVEKGQWVFSAADRDDVEAAGLTIIGTAGTLQHKAVDGMHREIVAASLEQIAAVARVFLKSPHLTSVEGVQAGKAARKAAQSEQFNCLGLYKIFSTPSGGSATRNLLKFVSEQIVVVRGSPNQAAAAV